VALLLQKRGITKIHPLAGGIDAWSKNKFPLETPAPIDLVVSAAIDAAPATVAKQKGEIL
jgi:hypothetical protein